LTVTAGAVSLEQRMSAWRAGWTVSRADLAPTLAREHEFKDVPDLLDDAKERLQRPEVVQVADRVHSLHPHGSGRRRPARELDETCGGAPVTHNTMRGGSG
jgi:hypothetical protein